MRVGDYDIQVLVTSRFSLDGGSMFGVIPKSLWEREITPDDRNRIPLLTRSLLLRGNGKTILVDTGNGDKWDDRMRNILATDPSRASVVTALNRHSLTPHDVTDVICTHLHFDHAGGNTTMDEDQIVPTFPNATYWLHRDNWDWANGPTEKDQGSYRSENWDVLAENGMFRMVQEEDDFIDGVEIRLTYGHTPGQMHPVLSDGETTVFVAGDLFPTKLHFRLPCIMAFDNEPLKTLEEKKAVLDRAVDEGWLILLAHDAETEAVRLAREGNAYSISEATSIV